MATRYLPRITAEQHDTFREIVKFYPADTYDKWLYLQAKEIADWRGAAGKSFSLMCPNEFARYGRKTRARSDINTFRGFAMTKAMGKSH
jgi:hypothetical protein